jgi:transcriptional regulator with XRE-family HTH domain
MSITSCFGKALKRLRVRRGLSQEQLSLESHLTRAFISDLERGKKEPALITIYSLARALNINGSELLQKLEEILRSENR